MELYEKTASELSEMLRSKEISSAELTESVFDRIEAVEDKVEAYVTLCKENAIEQAKELDNRRTKDALHPLAGIPIGIKDNISTKGILTTCSSKMLYNYVPPFNAHVIDRINDANNHRQAEYGRVRHGQLY